MANVTAEKRGESPWRELPLFSPLPPPPRGKKMSLVFSVERASASDENFTRDIETRGTRARDRQAALSENRVSRETEARFSASGGWSFLFFLSCFARDFQ